MEVNNKIEENKILVIGSGFNIYNPNFKQHSDIESLFQSVLYQYGNCKGTVYYQPTITYSHDLGFVLNFTNVYKFSSLHTIAVHNNRIWNIVEDVFIPELHSKIMYYRNKVFDFYKQFFQIAKTHRQSCLQLLIDDFQKTLPYYFNDLKLIIDGTERCDSSLENFDTDFIDETGLDNLVKNLNLILFELKTDYKKKRIIESVKQI